MTSLQSLKIKLISFICTLEVVLLHSLNSTRGLQEMGLARTQYIVSHIVTSNAVPWFFMLSGYLLFRKLFEDSKGFKWNLYLIEVYKRLRTLLLPYCIWCLFGGICYGVIELSISGHFKIENRIFGLNLRDIFFNTFCMPLNYPLWFIKYLLVLLLCVPILYRLLAFLKGKTILLFLCLLLVGPGKLGEVNVIPLYYFGIGGCLLFFGVKNYRPMSRIGLVTLGMMLSLILFIIWTGSNYDGYLIKIFGILESLLLWNFLDYVTLKPRRMYDLSFWVYVTHGIPMLVMVRVGEWLFSYNLIYLMLFQGFSIMVVLLMLVTSGILLKSRFSKFMVFILGGRI